MQGAERPPVIYLCFCVLQFYILRKLIENELGEQEVGEDNCYICSLSSRVLVYKGQLTPGQVHGVLPHTAADGSAALHVPIALACFLIMIVDLPEI